MAQALFFIYCNANQPVKIDIPAPVVNRKLCKTMFGREQKQTVRRTDQPESVPGCISHSVAAARKTASNCLKMANKS